MTGSFRVLVLVSALGGCAFDPAEGTGAPDDTQDPDKPIPPPANPVPRPCGSNEGGLVLCLDFDSDPLGFDSSTARNNAAVDQVTAVERVTGEQAITLSRDSRVLVPENQALELTGDYTIEMWVQPVLTFGVAALFDNYNQYAMRLDDGDVACGISGAVKSDKDDRLRSREWAHVACRYSGGQMKVFINGYVSSCKNYAAASTGGTMGSSVGARITGPATVDMQLLGSVDNVRVYNSALGEAELCAAAGQAPGSCRTECDDREEND